MAWQASYAFKSAPFDTGWICTQYGLPTLAEIDAQASNGTPTAWRDTLLRAGQSQGYVAKLSCEFRLLDVDYHEGDKDLLIKRLQGVFGKVSATSERKGGGQYTQHVINARAPKDEASLVQPRLRLTINDQKEIEDNLRGRLVLLVRASPS